MAEKKNRKNIRKVSSYTRLTTQRSLSVAVFAGTRTYTYARASEESERTPAGDLIRSRRRRRGRELRRRYAKAKGPKLRLARAPRVYNLHIAQLIIFIYRALHTSDSRCAPLMLLLLLWRRRRSARVRVVSAKYARIGSICVCMCKL